MKNGKRRRGRESLIGIGPLEGELLSILWTGGEMTIRDVYEEVRERHRSPFAYTTCATVLNNLTKKKLVRRRMIEDRMYLFKPAKGRDAVVLDSLKRLRDSLSADDPETWAKCCQITMKERG